MKREMLKELGLTDEQINTVMAENGKDIEALKTTETTLKAEIATLKADKVTLEAEKKTFETELTTARTAASGTDALQQQVNTLMAEKTQFDEKLKDVNAKWAIVMELAADCHDPELAASLIDMSKLEINDEGKIIKGLDVEKTRLQQEKAFIFKNPNQQQQQQKPAGFRPADGATSQEQNSQNQSKTLADAVAAALTKQ